MVGGKFELPDDLPGRQMVEGKYSLAPLYMIEINTELMVHVGVVQGEKIPIITDRNPHLEVVTKIKVFELSSICKKQDFLLKIYRESNEDHRQILFFSIHTDKS